MLFPVSWTLYRLALGASGGLCDIREWSVYGPLFGISHAHHIWLLALFVVLHFDHALAPRFEVTTARDCREWAQPSTIGGFPLVDYLYRCVYRTVLNYSWWHRGFVSRSCHDMRNIYECCDVLRAWIPEEYFFHSLSLKNRFRAMRSITQFQRSNNSNAWSDRNMNHSITKNSECRFSSENSTFISTLCYRRWLFSSCL